MERQQPSLFPTFKYHPDPLATGVIKQKQTTCPVCRQIRAYVYVGPFYSEENVEGICPWCIKDGSAANTYQGQFTGQLDCDWRDIDPKHLDELDHRTPGYVSWQSEIWLSHHNDLCAFVGYVGWKEIQPFAEELAEDLAEIKARFRWSDEQGRPVIITWWQHLHLKEARWLDLTVIRIQRPRASNR